MSALRYDKQGLLTVMLHLLDETCYHLLLCGVLDPICTLYFALSTLDVKPWIHLYVRCK